MGTYKWKPFTLLVSAEEVEKEVLKIEVGKFYKTRDGHKVGPAEVSEVNFDYPKARFFIHNYGLVQENGKFGNDEDSESLDLISEWQDEPSPIRTVTRREISDGVYGIVKVCNSATVMEIYINARPSPEELREAAHTLSQIAEVAEENE